MRWLTRLLQRFCKHPEVLTKTYRNRLYTECLKCGHISPGIFTGGHIFRGDANKSLQYRVAAFQEIPKDQMIRLAVWWDACNNATPGRFNA